MSFKYGKTAAYTILKDEAKFIEKWLYYTAKFDYRVLLDTGSTDGSWEMLQEAAEKDPNLIIKQWTPNPWRFDVARMANHAMIPYDVRWALSPDMDEYFSKNVLDEMSLIIEQHPYVTNISCDRLDIYSRRVRVGPPHFMQDGTMNGSPNLYGTNKIHLRDDYRWSQPIYEHLIWRHKDKQEYEIYAPNIYLIHDQDFKKKTRSELYLKMMHEEFARNPYNAWNLWFLVNHYYREKDLINFVEYSVAFLKINDAEASKRKEIYEELQKIYYHAPREELPIAVVEKLRGIV